MPRSIFSQTIRSFRRLLSFKRIIGIGLICSLLMVSCKRPGPTTRGPSPEEGASAIVRGLESISDANQREVTSVYTLNSLCTISRLASGKSEGRIETVLAPYFSKLQPEVKTKLQRLGETLKQIPTAKRAQLLGSLSGFDPGPCISAPLWETIKEGIIFSHVLVPRLRSNYCSGNFTYGDGTAADRSITVASSIFQTIEGPANVVAGASPVILGVEGNNTYNARHPALKATNPTPIQDGISPYGVLTDIPCSISNDPCTAAQGLICGAKIGSDDRCVAFPVMQKDQDLILRGYNFWDTEEARLVFTPLLPGVGTESTTIVKMVDAHEPSDGAAACPVASATNATHNRAYFNVGANEGAFYKLRFYNHNGTFRTQRDVADHAESRPIHVCYPNSLGPANLPMGTIRDCTTPSETCVQDGVPCAATWTTPPRKLDNCRHQPGQPVVCGETPEWFVNQPLTRRQDDASRVTDEPVVFVIRDEPKYEFRATLQAIECKNETGWDWTGSDEPMLMVIGMPSQIPAGTDQELIDKIEDYFGTYQGSDYDTGDRKLDVKLLSTVGDLNLDSRVEYLVALYEDDSRWVEYAAGLAGVFALAVIMYFAFPLALAVVGTASLVTIWTYVHSGMEEDDPLGQTNLLATPTIMDERIGADHAADLLTAGPAFGALPQFPGRTPVKQRANPALIHPFVDFKLDEKLQVECNPGFCGAGKTCIVNRCMPDGFVDPTAGRGFRERREFADSGSYYVVDMLWEKVPVP